MFRMFLLIGSLINEMNLYPNEIHPEKLYKEEQRYERGKNLPTSNNLL